MIKKIPFKVLRRTFETKEKIILRDYLALERTTMSNERTLFSYIRTSLYLIVGAVALVKVEDLENLRWVGYISFALSAYIIIYGLFKYFNMRAKLRTYYQEMNTEEPSKTGKRQE